MTSNQPTGQSDVDELNAVLNLTEGHRYDDASVEAVRDPLTGRITRSTDGSDDLLNVRFTTEAVFNKLLTHRAGGVPKYTDMDFVTISAPGQERNTLIHTPVTDYHQWRFPHEWAAFKQGKDVQVGGTPLARWPLMMPSQIKELDGLGIHTVEQVAALPDGNASQFRGFYTLKAKAKQFLEATDRSDKESALEAQLATRDAEMASMREQLQQLSKLVESQQKPTGDKADKGK